MSRPRGSQADRTAERLSSKIEEVEKLRAERDELVAALRNLLDGPIYHLVREGEEVHWHVIADARAALAKVQS